MLNLPPSYIPSPPGEDYDADAFNLVLACMRENWEFAHAITDHQISSEAAECMLAVVIAWLVKILGGFEPGFRDHILGHLYDEVMARNPDE